MDPEPRHPLMGLWRRAVRSPRYLAHRIAVWEAAHDGASAHEALQTSVVGALELGLCLSPRAERWMDDVREIASSTGIDPDRFAAWLRQAEALASFADAPAVEAQVDGRLLAARDRDDGDGR